MPRIIVITGAGAGVGRATAREFARHGDSVGLIGRDKARLQSAAAELRRLGVSTLIQPADVADAKAVDAAALQIERKLGPIDVWINNAMATIFAPVQQITPEEYARATQVTYLGTVHGTLAALRHMRPRNRGTIVNVGSALAYRSVPLQSAYCGAKSAIRGFTDSLRSELIHDRANIHLTMVHLPAVNTPQFAWARNKTGHEARPVPPVFQPEVAARAIYFAASVRRREIWVGAPTVLAIMANKFAAGFADWKLAREGYAGQMLAIPKEPNAADNLFEPVPGNQAAHGNFNAEARSTSWQMFLSRHRALLTTAGTVAVLWALTRLGSGRYLPPSDGTG